MDNYLYNFLDRLACYIIIIIIIYDSLIHSHNKYCIVFMISKHETGLKFLGSWNISMEIYEKLIHKHIDLYTYTYTYTYTSLHMHVLMYI